MKHRPARGKHAMAHLRCDQCFIIFRRWRCCSMKHIRTLSKAAPDSSSVKSDCGKCKCVCMPACRMSVTVTVQKSKVKK